MKIGVIMGGISSEREISIQSGDAVLEALLNQGYDASKIMIDHKEDLINEVKGYDFIFIVLHGKFGEDGSVQALLETMNIPYSGSGVLSSALCMDKMQTKRVLRSEKIKAPKGVLYRNGQDIDKIIRVMGSFPYVIKPNTGGSSIGVYLANSTEELKKYLKEASQFDDSILIEEYVKGEEYTISILGGEVLPTLKIEAEHEFFDYTCKYEAGKAIEEKAVLNPKMCTEIDELGRKCWDIFECKGYVRIDIIVKDDQIYVIELNTLPGMTKNSLLPKSAKIKGLSYETLVEQMLRYSL